MIIPEGDRVIDREAEAEIFKDLLAQRDNRQLFLISDKKNRGKSVLLKKLKYYCEWEHRPAIPNVLVRLDDIADPQPYQIVETIWRELRAQRVEFPTFGTLWEAMLNKNPVPFGTRAAANFQSAQISGGQSAAFIQNLDLRGTKVELQLPATAWDPGFVSYAREEAIAAFFTDLRAICAEQTVVVFIDSVDEQANQALREWVINSLARAELLEHPNRPTRLVLVLAGRADRSPFDRLKRNYPDFIRSLEALGAWSNEHVRAFLDLNRPDDAVDWVVDDADIDYLRGKINSGTTLQQALAFIKALRSVP